MLHPFPVRSISSPYGWRVHPERAERQFHHAIDYRVPAGSAVRPIATGSVVAVRIDERFGRVVEVDHGAGYRSRYAHMREDVPIAVDDHVTTSTEIGFVSDTGTAARGDHLHLELWHHGRHIDPARHLAERP